MARNDKEVRLANISDFQIERREDEGKLIIEGYAAVYDSEVLIGDESWGFYERIERGAFEKATENQKKLAMIGKGEGNNGR